MSNSDKVSKGLQDFIFMSKYARWDSKLGRRETWDEAVDRVCNMHLQKYGFLEDADKDKIRWAFSLVKAKRVLPSMRSMQFAGPATIAHNARGYNCSVRHVDSIRSFAEIAYLMLCGCGTGIGLSKHFLARLPNLVGPDDKTGSVITYVVEDTIEGWADSLEALLMCYFKNNAYSGRKIAFDYSKIRRKGAILKTGGGRAPGYKPLKAAHQRIKKLLDRIIEEDHAQVMRPIHAYDVMMHFADAVLSGGVRRTASSIIFDEDEEEMINAKTYFTVSKYAGYVDEETGLHHTKVKVNKHWYTVDLDEYNYNQVVNEGKIYWKHIEPQRSRSNNSVLLLRNKTSKQRFAEIVEKTKEFGEPGFVWANHPHTLYNPCVSIDTVVTTNNGLLTVENLLDTKFNALVDGQVYSSTDKGFYHTGNKQLLELIFKSGRKLKVTKNHKIMTTNGWKEAGDLNAADDVVINNNRSFHQGIDNNSSGYAQGYCLGSFLSDGNSCSHQSSQLKWWGEDKEIYRQDAIGLLERAGWKNGHHKYESCSVSTYSSIESKHLFEFAKQTKCVNAIGDNKHLDKSALNGSWDYLSGLVAGYFDGDGTVSFNPQKGSSVRILSTQLENLENLQIILNAFGIYSKIYNERLPEGYRLLPDGQGGMQDYYCQASHELCISNDSIQVFYEKIKIRNTDKKNKIEQIVNSYKRMPNRTNFVDNLVKVNILDNEDVYDCTIDDIHAFDANGVYVHNCFEIGFIPVTDDGECGVQFCNLTTLNGNLITSEVEFAECVEAQTIIGTLQAGYTHFPYLSKVAKQLTEEEALLGNSMTGVLGSPDILLCDYLLRNMAAKAVQVNKEWAAKIYINPASRTTAEKPEGTGSLALGVNDPGIHPAHARYFFRRVQNTKGDIVYEYFKKHNPHMCEESKWSANKTDEIITFPLKAKEGAIVKSDLSAIQHLEIIRKIQRNWVIPGGVNNKKDVTNNVSCTVIVKDNEWDDVIDFIYDNNGWFAAVSLLASDGDKVYEQAPFEKIESKEDFYRYNDLLDKYTEVDFTKLSESTDETTLVSEMACAGGACLTS